MFDRSGVICDLRHFAFWRPCSGRRPWGGVRMHAQTIVISRQFCAYTYFGNMYIANVMYIYRY